MGKANLTLYAQWKVKSRPTPPSPNVQTTITAGEALTEAALNGSTISVAISGANFTMSLTPESFELQNAPIGLTIREVNRISSTEAVLTFAFNGTPLDQDYDLGLLIHGAALTTGLDVAITEAIQLKKSAIPYKIMEKPGTFQSAKVWTVNLSTGVDAKTVQDALYLIDAEGNRLPVTFSTKGKYIFIQPSVGNYADGT